MATPLSDEASAKQRELMLRVARNPYFCGCCFRLSDEDKTRARRVFRLVRAITRAWEKEGRA